MRSVSWVRRRGLAGVSVTSTGLDVGHVACDAIGAAAEDRKDAQAGRRPDLERAATADVDTAGVVALDDGVECEA